MAMIKERQRDKCGSVEKKGRNRNNSTVVARNNNILKNISLENNARSKEQSNRSPSSQYQLACSFAHADTNAFGMDMCPVENFMLDAPLSSCQTRKTEDVMNSDPVFPPDPCDGMMSMSATESLVDSGIGIRPLCSNVISRQPTTVDAQYMQQQSQVFVFSTLMANKSAESVKKGKYNSIIDYHCAQPDTKKFLQRNPLKTPQFRQQNYWANNNIGPVRKSACGMTNPRMGGKVNFRNNPMMNAGMMNQGCGGPPPTPQPAGMGGPPRIPMWSQRPNMNPNMIMSNPVLPPPPQGNFNDDQFPLSPRTTSLAGIQIPDENLTPAQLQVREEKLAYLQTIKLKLMPENQQGPSQMPMNTELPPSTHNAPLSIDDISSVLAADNNSGNSAPLGDSGDVSLPKPTNIGPGTPSMMPGDWQNMYFEDRCKRIPDVNNMSRCGPRSQGPPPPYHQTARSASVPIAVPSPNPNSPGNATSNLSLPSPRTCSGMNSPASKPGPGPSPTINQMNANIESPGQSHCRGMNISNPGTPVSSSIHLSPTSKQKDGKMCAGPMTSEFSPAASGQQSPDGIYSRSLQSLARQQQQKQQPPMPHTQSMPPANSHCKEPPLMPVPSPQHIQYLSSFEGQELTIQKQPNTSLKDTSNISPSLSQGGLDSMIPVSTDGSCSKVNVSAPNTPLTPSSMADLGSKYPGTPGDFSALSPNGDPKAQLRGINSNQLKNDLRFSCGSPQLPEQQRFPPTNANFMSQTNKNAFMDASSPEKASCGLGGGGGGPDTKDSVGPSCAGGNFPRGMMPNNVPIDPTAAPKPSFDPISSLAQMSQQLTNNVPGGGGSMCPTGNDGGMGGGGGGPMSAGGNMLGQYPPPMMGQMGQPMPNNLPGPMCPSGADGGPMVGPKQGGPMPGQFAPMMGGGNPGARMMRPPGPMPGAYNNANVSVKPNAPNTIQYVPNRPQTGPGMGARGPPSLEFLRYQNPNAMPPNMEKMHPPPPHPNMNYFQGNYGGGPPPGANMNEMMGNMNCNMPPGNPMIRAGMRGPNPPQPPPNMMRMGGGNMGMPPGAYNDQMYAPPGAPNMPNNNCHMFMPNAGGPGPKMPPMGMGGNVAPDATQPLPPSMGQANNFKNPSFMGQLTPEMNDPQYRQQFHNFQQQLYATNTRSQMSNQPMAGSNQQYFLPK